MILTYNWWALALRGIIAIVVGLLTLIYPEVTFAVLILLFGTYAILDGILATIAATRAAEEHKPWWSLLIEGVVGIIFGLITFFAPGLSAELLLYLIALWAIITGSLEVVAAISLRKEIEGEWALALAGGVSTLFGILLIAFPQAATFALASVIGIFALLFGLSLLSLGLRLKLLGSKGLV